MSVALVTGGSRGTGAAVAEGLASHGVEVVIGLRDEAKLARASKVASRIAVLAGDDPENPSFDRIILGDLTTDVPDILDQFGERFGDRIGYLILTAAGGLERDASENHARAINCDALLNLTYEADRRGMLRSSVVVYTPSTQSHYLHDGRPITLSTDLYRPVAQAKHDAEVGLREWAANAYHRNGSQLVLVCTDLIANSATGRLLRREVIPGVGDKDLADVRRQQVREVLGLPEGTDPLLSTAEYGSLIVRTAMQRSFDGPVITVRSPDFGEPRYVA